MENTTSPIWRRGFLLLCVLIAIFGMIVTYFGVVGISSGRFGPNLLSASRSGLLLDGVFLIVYLIGLPFAKGQLLRFGLLFQAGYLTFNALTLLLLLGTVKTVQIPFAEADQAFLFSLLPGPLRALGFVCLSYGVVRFQSSDRIFLGVQVLLALGITGEWVREVGGFGNGIFLQQFLLIEFLGVAGLVSLLFRPACWKAHPFITGCLTVGETVSLLLGTALFSFLPDVLQTQLSNGVGLIGETLFLLGVLLLIRSKRLSQDTRREQVSLVPPARE